MLNAFQKQIKVFASRHGGHISFIDLSSGRQTGRESLVYRHSGHVSDLHGGFGYVGRERGAKSYCR
jgi:hypothetical protein